MQHVELFGIPFAAVSQAELLDWIIERTRRPGLGCVTTANVQHVGMAQRDPAFRRVLLGSELITADGGPICWVAKLCGRPLSQRVTGSDLVLPLAERCAREGRSLFLLGGELGVASGLAKQLRSQLPQLRIAGTATPPHLDFERLVVSQENRRIVAQIRAARPDVLLVALGAPKQEQWIHRHRGELGPGVAIGVGASFDFLVGRQRRAPRWIQRVGLEWAHRAALSPGRLLPRYLRNGATFARASIRELATRRPAAASAATERVAYLINQYPVLSHTFVRREIQAVEQLGIRVLRFSIRATRDQFANPEDRAEAEKTRSLLGSGVAAPLGAVLHTVLSRPLRSVATLVTAIRLGARSDRGVARHLAYFVEACLLRRWLDRERVPHLHAHFGTNPAMVALLCRRLGGPPFSFTVHGPEEFDRPEAIALAAKIRGARFVVAVSEYGRSQLYRWCDVADWPKIHVVRCGLDTSWLAAPRTAPPVEPRLVCVSRLAEQKGQLVLLEAVHRLAREGRDVVLHLVGDGPLRGSLEQRIRTLDLGAHVRLCGALGEEGVRAQILGARALVQPSFAEGLPVTLMEAFALGRPVVSTFVAGIPELVEPGASGWLVPAGAVDALADALVEVLVSSPETLEKMAAVGASAVAVNHSVRTEAGKLAELIRTSPERPDAPGPA